ncbi:MAG: argininosuccinate lyase [Dehalococcoidia bacterium]
MNPMRKRFKKDMAQSVQKYTESISYDRRLYKYDIAGSIVHAEMLAKQGVITVKEAKLICDGLASIWNEIDKGKFVFKAEHEDIHMNIEARLIEKVGGVGRKLHTARSRNDQVALDVRMYVKEAIGNTIEKIKALQGALLDVAESNKDAVMPGYTHVQRAQPVLFAHHLLAYCEMLERDVDRFIDCLMRADVMPLGSGALAGTPYPLDRDFVAKELDFAHVSQNSMDAVSDRDFVIEYEAAASITMMHLSRLAEEMVLWSTPEFGFIEIDDAYATSSSMMPQKKNPDVAELARGKTGRVYGHLMAMLTLMKGLPLTYNRDMQEDKEGLFDTVDTLIGTLDVFAGMVATLKFNAGRAAKAAGEGYILATDLADYLVAKGMPFREAHGVVAGLVQYAIDKGKTLDKLSISDYKKFSPKFSKDVLKITAQTSVAARNAVGGTAPAQVKTQIARMRKTVNG